jgi:hypothetical protein
MSEYKNIHFVRTDGNRGILLQKNVSTGRYTLNDAWEGNDGEIRPNFCKVKRGNNPERNIPLGIGLGDNKEMAEALLQTTLEAIRHDQ